MAKFRVEVFLTDKARLSGVISSCEVEFPDKDCEEKPVVVMDSLLDTAHKQMMDVVDFRYIQVNDKNSGGVQRRQKDRD